MLLLVLLAECLWTIARQPLDANDYRYARCGREMWERPSVLQGYFHKLREFEWAMGRLRTGWRGFR